MRYVFCVIEILGKLFFVVVDEVLKKFYFDVGVDIGGFFYVYLEFV